MLKQDQTRETDREDVDLVDLGAASELTQTTGNFGIEVNLEPRVWKD